MFIAKKWHFIVCIIWTIIIWFIILVKYMYLHKNFISTCSLSCQYQQHASQYTCINYNLKVERTYIHINVKTKNHHARFYQINVTVNINGYIISACKYKYVKCDCQLSLYIYALWWQLFVTHDCLYMFIWTYRWKSSRITWPRTATCLLISITATIWGHRGPNMTTTHL